MCGASNLEKSLFIFRTSIFRKYRYEWPRTEKQSVSGEEIGGDTTREVALVGVINLQLALKTHY